MLEAIYNKIKSKWDKALILDKYIITQLFEFFILGIIVFTSLIFASTAFTQTIKQISEFGIPFNIAFMMIVLNLPQVFVMSIPISTLLATIMTINRLSLNSEISVLKACGIGIKRISKPVMFFALIASLAGIFINEFIVPSTSMQSKELAIYSLQQRHVPEGKTNYTLKETKIGNGLKRLFYVQKCEDKKFKNVTVVDMSKDDTVQIIQAKEGKTAREGWVFDNGVIYTLGKNEKTLNTALFDSSTINFGLDTKSVLTQDDVSQFNFIKLLNYIHKNSKNKKFRKHYKMKYMTGLWDKLALPLSTLSLALIGIPLAITPPRVRYNRGFLFSVIVIFIYFVIRACSINLGETQAISPFLAAWLPVIVLTAIGYILYYRKVYKI